MRAGSEYMISCLARKRVVPRARALRGGALLMALLTVACGRAPGPVALDIPTRFPAAPRVVAIGDLHGDLAATRAVLRLAGAVGERDEWIGGDLVLVQTGDQLDRGDDELEIVDLLDRLAEEAAAAGGAVHVLNGNHEFLNVKGDVRYVTLDGFADFLEEPVPGLAGAEPSKVVAAVLARMKAFKPGGPMALRLAARNVVVVVGETVFVHGGVLPKVAEYGVERLNQESREWLRGERSGPPDLLLDREGPVWSRHYSKDTDGDDCRLLGEALAKLGASRMVVGHTVQKDRITSGCDGRVWRIDVGLSRHYGGTPSALEIVGDEVRALRVYGSPRSPGVGSPLLSDCSRPCPTWVRSRFASLEARAAASPDRGPQASVSRAPLPPRTSRSGCPARRPPRSRAGLRSAGRAAASCPRRARG